MGSCYSSKKQSNEKFHAIYNTNFETNLEPKIRKMSGLSQGGPPRIPQNPENIWAQKGPGPNFWGPRAPKGIGLDGLLPP